ncbi:hypothetical protein Tco_0717351 [Tanacetum coccineum]
MAMTASIREQVLEKEMSELLVIAYLTQNFMKSTSKLQSTEGLANVVIDIAYAMNWAELKKKMTDKYRPRTEIKKLEVELWELKVKGTDVIGSPANTNASNNQRGTEILKSSRNGEEARINTSFHVSNLKKCHADEPLAVPLDGLHFDDKLQFVEEPVEIMDREVKRLKRSRIPLVKVRWNSRRGPEFTWEREDQFRKKYPHLFTKTAPSSSAAS